MYALVISGVHFDEQWRRAVVRREPASNYGSDVTVAKCHFRPSSTSAKKTDNRTYVWINPEYDCSVQLAANERTLSRNLDRPLLLLTW